MANIQSLRGEAQPASTANASQPPALQPWRAGRSADDRLVDLLGFALATERGLAPTAETIEQLRHEAATTLADHAIRHLHNRVTEIRHEAVMEHVGRLPRPPGFLGLVLANLVAIVLAAGAAGWLYHHPDAWPASWLLHSLAAPAGLITG